MSEENNQMFNEGEKNSHDIHDPKDQRSLANRMEAEERSNDEPEDDSETAMSKADPTLPARSHGNEPSKGAKIDAQIENEEEEELERKGKA